MFICPICGDKLISDLNESTYKTLCGHVFHDQCIITSLESSESCPVCHNSVSKNELFRLFLQVDPRAQITLKEKNDETKDELNKKLEFLTRKEPKHIRSVNNIQSDLNNLENSLNRQNKLKDLLKIEVKNMKKNITEIATKKELLHKKFDESEVKKTKLRTEIILLKSKIKSQHYAIYKEQSLSSTIINQLKLDKSMLKSETAYCKRRCYNTDNNLYQPSTSKMNIESKNSISLQNPTENKYYGHDPKLHLSSNQFLHGCIFLFIDVRSRHEENNDLCITTIHNKVNVIKYGGSVVPRYAACVTHVICYTQTHYVVEKAIEEGKRCVTNYWLSDIFVNKRMIPPSLGLHFPLPFSIHNLPCQRYQFAIDNFNMNDSHIVKTMIELVGGKYVVNGITPMTNFLISPKLEGEIVEKARANGITVVNVQWLNDILFGAINCVTEPTSLKYQQFDLSNPFLVNYDKVSRLMEAWKSPLDVHKNNLNFDPDSPTQFKRQKTISENPKMTNLIDDNKDVMITCVKKKVLPNACVMLSGFTTDRSKILKEMVLSFGGTVANFCCDATHLIMRSCCTSAEFFGCISTVQYVLNEDWIKDSHSRLTRQDEKNYSIPNIIHERMGLFSIPAILENKIRHLLFQNIAFHVTSGCPSATFLKELIIFTGGTVEKVRRKVTTIKKNAPNNSYFIISCEEDRHLYNDLMYIRNVIYLPDFIFSSILKQQLQLKRYLLEFTA